MSTAPVSAAATARRESGRTAALLAVGIAVAVAVICIAFAWPAVRSGLHEVPIGIAAPGPAAQQLAAGLDTNRPGAFDVTIYPSEAELVSAVEARDIYGGVVLGPSGVTVVTASAASPVIAQALGQVGTAIADQQGAGVTVTDVVPSPEADPRGAGLAASALPLTLSGILPAYVFAFLYPRRLFVRTAAALSVAVLTGFAVAAILTYWFGSVEENYVAVALGLALASAAISSTLLGLNAIGGNKAMGVGVAVFLLLGNPLSGLSSAPEFLPSGWGALGQLLPPGASATLLRSNAFFDGAGSSASLLVLTSWLLLGLGLTGVAAARRRRTAADGATPRLAPAHA